MAWHDRRSNVNDRYRSLRTDVARSVTRANEAAKELNQYMAARAANAGHGELVAIDAARYARRHMLRLKEVARTIAASPDKRRRPRGVTKAEFKEVRRLKLTQTAKFRRKK
ncbi:MAG: hypothetical protein AAB919_01215 [Patescibacteria group bacterium]